ncbi:MAG: DUF340 domain-containing protein [Sedimentibacter sp.]
MIFRVFLYFSLMAVGWFLSNRGLINTKLMNKISLIQTIILFGLILIMGIRVGMDKQVISSIGQIGIIAAVFAVLTSGFSILFVYIARKKFITNSIITGDKND